MVIKNGKTMKWLSISRSNHRRCSVKKCYKKFRKFHRKTSMLESLFNKVPCLQVCNFIKKRLQHRCFPVKFAKFLRTPILKSICERLLCISYVLHKYVSHVKKNYQRTWTKFIIYLRGFHKMAILENPSKDDLSDSKENAS